MPTNNTIEARLQSRIEEFVDEISELVREEAVNAVRGVLMAEAGLAQPTRPKRATKKTAKRGATKARRKKGGRRVRRSAEDLQAMGDRLLAHVRANPGERLEQIGEGLGEDTADLKRPVQLLMESGQLRTTGQRRGTKYFPGKGRATRKKAAKKKKAGKKRGRKTRATGGAA